MRSSRLALLGPVALLAFIIGCDSSTNPAGPEAEFRAAPDPTPTPGVADIGEVEVCAVGPQTILGVIIDGVRQPRFRLGPNECTVVATTAALGKGNHTVTVYEDILTGRGQVLDSIVATFMSKKTGPQVGAPLTGVRQVTQTFNGDKGWLVQFFNHEPAAEF